MRTECGFVRFPTMRPASSSYRQFRIAREGKGWLAVAPGFCNLEISPFGYGLTQEAAVVNLLGSSEYQRLAAREAWRFPSLSTFVEVETVEDDTSQAYAPRQVPRLICS